MSLKPEKVQKSRDFYSPVALLAFNDYITQSLVIRNKKMTKSIDAKPANKNDSSNTLGKIITSKKPAEQTNLDIAKVDEKKLSDNKHDVHKDRSNYLLEATRLFLRHHGVRKSGAAIRDAVEMPHDIFATGHAISALSNLGFKTSFGSIKLSKLKAEMLPLILFRKDGVALFVKELSDDNKYICTSPEAPKNDQHLSSLELSEIYSGYVILAKELTKTEKKERDGHWFFSAFRKSKWLYVQVMVAAMVSNFLSLSTSLLQ